MVQFCCVRPCLGIEIVFCRLLLQSERMDIDLNLKKSGQLFSSFSSMPVKITKTFITMVTAL